VNVILACPQHSENPHPTESHHILIILLLFSNAKVGWPFVSEEDEILKIIKILKLFNWWGGAQSKEEIKKNSQSK